MTLVALVTEDRLLNRDAAKTARVRPTYYQNVETERALMQSAFRDLGIRTEIVSWEAADTRWEAFDAALLRTTWNYFDRFESFCTWLTDVERRTLLINPPNLVRWNWDKRYLAELEKHGVRTVPSVFVAPDETLDLEKRIRRSSHGECILKPTVSGGARHTYRVNAGNHALVAQQTRTVRQTETFILQEVQRSVLDRGEVSLLFFGGNFSHAVRKVAKHGDFRVQDDHGGTVHAYEPRTNEIELATCALAALPLPATYARVDMVDDNAGNPAVMELELIEPELFMRFHPTSANALAAAVQTTLL